jgi:hypothetical protein
MIHSLAENAQFITTTFRPEMLVTADQFYGVLFNKDKISSIRRIEREEAQEFVDQVLILSRSCRSSLMELYHRRRRRNERLDGSNGYHYDHILFLSLSLTFAVLPCTTYTTYVHVFDAKPWFCIVWRGHVLAGRLFRIFDLFSASTTMTSAESFAAFSYILDGRILRALADLGFARPTLVQAKAIPLALDSRDILCRARTGSGKTAAYSIPLVQKILQAKSVGVSGHRNV